MTKGGTAQAGRAPSERNPLRRGTADTLVTTAASTYPTTHTHLEGHMTIPVCDHCERYIERSNRRWPGYCAPTCRTAAHQQRELQRRKRLARRDVLPAWVMQ